MSMFGMGQRARKSIRPRPLEEGMLPVGNIALDTPPPESNVREGMFGADKLKRNEGQRWAAFLSDAGDALVGGPMTGLDEFYAGEKTAQGAADWAAQLGGMDLSPEARTFAEMNPEAFQEQQFLDSRAKSQADEAETKKTQRVNTIIDGIEDWDPRDLMALKQDPDGWLKASMADKFRDDNYAQEQGDISAREAAEREYNANKPQFFNTGQAVGFATPGSRDATVVYRDPAQPTSSRKTFKAATPEEIARRGYAPGTTGQIDSDGRFYPDKPARTQARFSPGEISTMRKKADGNMILGNAVKTYMDTLNRVGPKLFEDAWDKNGVDELKTAHGLITSAIKEAQELGALDQGVQNLVDSIVSNPIGFGNFGKSAESIGKSAQKLYDNIDYTLSRIPEEYRGGATGNTTMAWKAPKPITPPTPQEVQRAKALLAIPDVSGMIRVSPEERRKAKAIVDASMPGGMNDMDEDLTDDQYDAAFDSYADIDLAEAPEGVDQRDWDDLTDEEKRDYLEAGE